MVKGRHIIILASAIFCLSGCAGTRLSKSEKIGRVITTARSYLGTPYRMGGMSKKGIDCSGLLYMSFKSAGITLPREAKYQSKTGKRVELDEIKPGDMVFFSSKKGKRKITHAGLVTDRHGNKSIKFIHSSTSHGVVEANLLDDYYQSIFIRARRPRY